VAEGKQVTLTHGIVGTDAKEHAVSRVPGEVRFSVEIRADKSEALHEFHSLLKREAEKVEEQRGVTFAFDQAIVNEPAPMHPRWIERLDELCALAGVPHEHLASGAGHDAAVFAHAGIPTAMLFIRNARGSHNPDEGMDIGDLMLGVQVLAEALISEP